MLINLHAKNTELAEKISCESNALNYKFTFSCHRKIF